MAPIIHCVRHAQGFHNLGVEFHGLPDPRLTPHGESQCATLCSSLAPDFHSRLSLITASPLCRTIHTAHLSFRPALASEKCHPEIFAIPDVQEISDYPCDTGSDPDVLKVICEQQSWRVDDTLVVEGWNVKTGRYKASSEAIAARAAEARRLLRSKIDELAKTHSQDQDVEIVLVSHGGFLHYFTGDWEGATNRLGTGWANCEIRSYNFSEREDDLQDGDGAWLVETMESRGKRGLEMPMKRRNEQKIMYEKAMKGWEEQGLTTPLAVRMPDEAPRVDSSKEVGEPIERTLTAESRRSAVEVSV